MTRRKLRHKSTGRVAALLALLGLAAGCGIPVDASAKPLNAAQQNLLRGTPQVPSNYMSGSTPFTVYFIRGGSLYPVRRYINSSTLSTTAEATAALAALDLGPSSNELTDGIFTTLIESPRTVLRIDSINQKGHYARVILDSEFSSPDLFGSTLAQAYAQIVYTLTASLFVGQISAVEFELNGIPAAAYLPNGALDFGPVTQQDYAVFAKGSPTTPGP